MSTAPAGSSSLWCSLAAVALLGTAFAAEAGPSVVVELPWSLAPHAEGAALDCAVPALAAALLAPEDLRAIDLHLPAAGAGATVAVVAADSGALLGELPVRDGRLDLGALAPRLGSAPAGLVLRGLPTAQRQAGRYTATITAHPRLPTWPAGDGPQDGVFACVCDGHLWYGGARLRLWGAVVNHRAAQPAVPEQLRRAGFNAVRLWGPPRAWYDADSLRRGTTPPDGAEMDAFDRLVAGCRAQGLFVMGALLGGDPACAELAPHDINGRKEPSALGRALLADDSWLAGGADWEAWKAAVTTAKAPLRHARYLDPRLERVYRWHVGNVLAHRNPHTGRRYAEEEAVALWELENENGFIHAVLAQGVAEWPGFFRAQLQGRWNAWLVERHRDRAGLERAWGALPADEDPAAGSVAVGPTLSQRRGVPPARSADLARFLVDTVCAWNRRQVAHCRSFAPAGRGVAVAPFSADTLYQNDPAWLLANTASAEVNCFGVYSYTLSSALGAPPGQYILDHNTVAGAPTVLYEVNAGRPNPFRAEFPLRIAALAGWQDWDGVFWHMWRDGGSQARPDEQHLVQGVAQPEAHDYTACVHLQDDPAMIAALGIAGTAFRTAAIPPAPAPLTLAAGAQALFAPQRARGLPLEGAAFSRGARLELRPDDQDLDLRWSEPPPARPATAALAAGALSWDWPRGRLLIDAPRFKAVVGQAGGTARFRDGVAIGGCTRPWAVLAVASADGRDLAGADPARRILVATTADAHNRGFAIDLAGAVGGGGFEHPLRQRERIRDPGRAPVQADAVGCTVWFPRALAGRAHSLDRAARRCGDERLDGNRLELAARPRLLAELTVEAWGAAAETPADQPPAAAAGAAAPVAGGAPVRRLGIWHPLPG
ncbi:MAG: hypothetical protein L6R48_22625, partial [Planctomycetes bacterium]|nr:hypothetical protein [Planctomycetota bacterium]